MIYEKIDLISEMLDATLNLKCFCIKGLNDDLSFIKELMLPIFVDNNKEKDKLHKEIARCNGMLNNEKFTSKAPQAKIDEEKAKLEKYSDMLAQVEERLKTLSK